MRFGIKKGIISGGAMGLIYLIIFCTYCLAFWYGSKLVREEEAYTPGVMLIVSKSNSLQLHYCVHALHVR